MQGNGNINNLKLKQHREHIYKSKQSTMENQQILVIQTSKEVHETRLNEFVTHQRN